LGKKASTILSNINEIILRGYKQWRSVIEGINSGVANPKIYGGQNVRFWASNSILFGTPLLKEK